MQACGPGEGERVGELLGRVRRLLAVHAQADEGVVALVDQVIDHGQRLRRGVRAEHVGDEAAVHAKVGLRRGDAGRHALEHDRDRYSTPSVQGRVEEHLPVAQVARPHAVLERFVDASRVVVGVTHRGRDESKQLEELLAALVVIKALGARRRQSKAMFGSQFRHRAGPDRPFEMTVELNFWDPADELLQAHP